MKMSPRLGYVTLTSMPNSSRRSYMSAGNSAVARSRVLRAGAPHHGGRAVRFAARSAGDSSYHEPCGPERRREQPAQRRALEVDALLAEVRLEHRHRLHACGRRRRSPGAPGAPGSRRKIRSLVPPSPRRESHSARGEHTSRLPADVVALALLEERGRRPPARRATGSAGSARGPRCRAPAPSTCPTTG